jgi:hypothetical protein
LIGPWKKKVETMEPPQNRRLYGKMEYLSLWPTYIGKKGRTLGKLWAKHMGLMQGAIGSTLGEHIGNLGKILGT